MDAIVKPESDVEAGINAQGKLYRFLSLCFAHPDTSTLDWWRGGTADDEVLTVVADLPRAGDLAARLAPSLTDVVGAARDLSAEELELTYIAMFSCGVPQVLCPPYSSLYTSRDDDKRLAEMHAVKTFYAECGMELAADFRDLPDHASVEFEFLQYLAYEENLARVRALAAPAKFLAGKAQTFLDRHVLGLVNGMAAVAETIRPENFYCQIIRMAAEVVRYDHQHRTAAAGDSPSVLKGKQR